MAEHYACLGHHHETAETTTKSLSERHNITLAISGAEMDSAAIQRIGRDQFTRQWGSNTRADCAPNFGYADVAQFLIRGYRHIVRITVAREALAPACFRSLNKNMDERNLVVNVVNIHPLQYP